MGAAAVGGVAAATGATSTASETAALAPAAPRNRARTHTGAMVGNHAVMAALVGREGVVLVETLEELIDSAEIFARFPQPPAKGAAVMTNSGAFKGYALDFAETIGLELPELSPISVDAIKAVLPPFAAIENPVDVTAQSIRDATILGRTAASLLADPAMGSLVVSIVPGAPSLLLGFCVTWLAAMVHLGGVRFGSAYHNAWTALKLLLIAALFALAAGGCYSHHHHHDYWHYHHGWSH